MIPERNPYNNWAGNGNTTTFDFDFYIEDETQLAVYHTNAQGVQTQLKYGTDYSINETKNENGSYITFPITDSTYEVLQEDEIISLCLDLPISQENEYGKSSFLDLSALEYSLDYLTRVCQIINRQLERSVKTQEGSSQSADELIDALQQAQVNASASAVAAQSSAVAAQSSAVDAQSYAINAGEEATIATQKVAEISELYETATADIAAKHSEAIEEIAHDSSNAKSEILAAQTTVENSIADKKIEFSTDAENKSTELSNQYNMQSSNLQNQYISYSDNLGKENQPFMEVSDRLYKGVNIEEKFALEIALYDSKYAWLDNRKNTGDFTGIHVGDYFYTTMKAGTVAGYTIAAQTFTCRIVGINTYYGCADTNIGNMLYIHTDEVIDTPIKWNPTDNNNGTSNRNNPWLASAMYAILNGENNYDATSGYNKVAHGANASSCGIINLLESKLVAVLKQKRNILDSRYSSSGLLTGGTTWTWADMGKLYLPNEIEVYGCGIRSDRCLTSGFWFPEAGLSIQFPWYANNCGNRVKRNSSGTRCFWWLSSVASYNSFSVCHVTNDGFANGYSATNATVYAPLCFCI